MRSNGRQVVVADLLMITMDPLRLAHQAACFLTIRPRLPRTAGMSIQFNTRILCLRLRLVLMVSQTAMGRD